ncbi:helix-turn-helix transcriptional regulator [Nodosilinea sp. FACHB-141]|nr:helix-turn-helix transcriptional regulator [Nodosilinea sp. FACHB-141]
MVTILPTAPPDSGNSRVKNQGEAIVLALHRPQRNFTERDRTVLNLLRPHIAQAFQNAQILTQSQQSLAQLNHVIDQLGTISVAANGQVRHMSQRAWKLLVQYFQSISLQSQSLPDNLQRWFNHQITLITEGRNLSTSCRPLIVEREGWQLVVRLIVNEPEEQYLLLLEEEALVPLSAASLELVGLTKREAEVLFWVTQDKSDAEIAKTLGLSIGTVKKHLEHVYQKFDVHTRTAAVMYALKSLGLLR